jgi:hypothetical protein
MTTEKYVTVEDVSGSREVYSAPVSLYFDTIGYKEVEDVKIPQGVGRFNIEILLAKACGINVEKFNSAGLLACRFFVDAILPFVILFPVSLLTGHRDPRAVAEFYAKLKTPVAATPELDLIEVEKSRKDPSRFDHKKMFRNTCWEFTKFDKADFWGTVFCLLAVLFIIKAALWLFSFRGN